VIFTKLAIKGGVLVDGAISGKNIAIKLTNANSSPTARTLKVWLPTGTTDLSQSPPGTVVADGYASLSVTVPASSEASYLFVLPPDVTLVGIPTEAVVVGTTINVAASSTNAADTAFTWSSSDESVATVVALDGAGAEVFALSAGTATITVTGNISGATASFTITVQGPPPKTPVVGLAGLAALTMLLSRAALLRLRK
jgi:hypothetical protein